MSARMLDVDPDTLSGDDAWPLAVAEGFFVEDRGIDGWAWGQHGEVHGDGFATISDARTAAVGEWRAMHRDDWCETCGPSATCPACVS